MLQNKEDVSVPDDVLVIMSADSTRGFAFTKRMNIYSEKGLCAFSEDLFKKNKVTFTNKFTNSKK